MQQIELTEKKLRTLGFEGTLASNRFSLGMDISARNCGLALISLDLSVVIAKTLDLGPITPEGDIDSLWFLLNSVQSFCVEAPPEIAVIEDYAFASKHRVAWHGERGGVAKLAAGKFLKDHCKVLPIQIHNVKKFATGSGSWASGKTPLQEYVTSLGFEFKTEHEADALVLALIGVYFLRNRLNLPKHQKHIIDELRSNWGI